MTNLLNLREISTQELMNLGVQDVAYVKPVAVEGGTGYAIHAADGTALAVVENRALAFATVRQNGLEPVSVH